MRPLLLSLRDCPGKMFLNVQSNVANGGQITLARIPFRDGNKFSIPIRLGEC